MLAVNTIPFSLYVTNGIRARTDDLDPERNILIKARFKKDDQRTLFNFHSFVVKAYRYCLSVSIFKQELTKSQNAQIVYHQRHPKTTEQPRDSFVKEKSLEQTYRP